jgi:uncharacterized protein YukE
MTSRKINEAATDIDDASETVDELRAQPNLDVDTTDKLDELHETLEHAADTLDEADENADKNDPQRDF